MRLFAKIFSLRTVISFNPFSLIPLLSPNSLSLRVPTFCANLRCSPPSALFCRQSGNPGLSRTNVIDAGKRSTDVTRMLLFRCLFGRREARKGHRLLGQASLWTGANSGFLFLETASQNQGSASFFVREKFSNLGRLFGFREKQGGGLGNPGTERRSPVGSSAAVCRDGLRHAIRVGSNRNNTFCILLFCSVQT